MPDELKVGDVVMVTCNCDSCQRLGSPDLGPNNGPFIIEEVESDGVRARIPFGNGETRYWLSRMPVKFTVVGRADDAA